MLIAESKQLHDAFLDRIKAKYLLVANRSEDGKVHLSDLTGCLTKAYHDRTDFLPPSDETALMFARGWLLEDFSIMDIHMEPFEVDGITMSVDAFLELPVDIKSTLLAPTTSSGCAVCGEPRSGHTKASTGHSYEVGIPKPFEFPEEWKRRFAAYRWGLNRQVEQVITWNVPATRAHIQEWMTTKQAPQISGRFGVVVFHLIQSQVKAYELRWTPDELEANWAWVLERKDTLNRLLADDTAEPFRWNAEQSPDSWDCRSCVYLLRCQLQASLDMLKEKNAE